jgi:hypothetical protein
MSRRKNSGYLLEITDGTHKGKKGLAKHVDQVEAVRKAGKVLLNLLDNDYQPLADQKEKVLISAKFCVIRGFFD